MPQTDDPRLAQLWRDSWAGQPATRGTLPRVPQRATLPTASAALVGSLVRIPGATGVADATYECKKGSDDAYSWVQIDAAAPSTDALPKGVLGYAVGTTSQSFTAGAGFGDITGLTVTVTLTADRLIRVSAEFPVSTTGTNQQFNYGLDEDGTFIVTHNWVPAAAAGLGLSIWAIATSTAGSHTFKARGSASNQACNLFMSSSVPGYLVVEDIGAAP